jgi:hypothetical protein
VIKFLINLTTSKSVSLFSDARYGFDEIEGMKVSMIAYVILKQNGFSSLKLGVLFKWSIKLKVIFLH